MRPSPDPGYVVNSALRVSGPTIYEQPAQRLLNGGFDGNTLDPWTSDVTQSGDSFQAENGQAVLLLHPEPYGGGRGQGYCTIRQSLTVPQGSAYFMSAYLLLDLSQLINRDLCAFYIQSDRDTFWQAEFNTNSRDGLIYGSGIVANDMTTFQAFLRCLGTSPARVALDGVNFFTYGGSPGVNPIIPQPRSLLVNGNFDTGAFAPWTKDANSGTMDFSVQNGRATVSYNRIDARFTSPSWIMQTIPLVQVGQTYTMTLDVEVYIPPGTSTVCVVQVSYNQNVWLQNNIASSQSFAPIIRGSIIIQDSTFFGLYSSCTGNSVAVVYWDNVVFTVNT